MGWVRIFSAIVVLFFMAAPGTLSAGQVEPAGPCHTRCYQAKRQAYQRCRAIPPTDRSRRNACFRNADDTLTRCLGQCG